MTGPAKDHFTCLNNEWNKRRRIKPLKEKEKLHHAVQHHQKDYVKKTLQKNPLLKNTAYAKGFTLLHIASELGYVNLVEVLVKELKFKPDHPAYCGVTPLLSALQKGQVQTAQLLLRLGASPTAYGLGAHIIFAIAKQKNYELLRLLLAYNANIEATSTVTVSTGSKETQVCDRHGYTALHLAARNNNVDATRFLLENGAAPNYANDRGETALHIAARKGATDVVKALLRSNANMFAQDKKGYSPSFYAKCNKHTDISEALVANLLKSYMIDDLIPIVLDYSYQKLSPA